MFAGGRRVALNATLNLLSTRREFPFKINGMRVPKRPLKYGSSRSLAESRGSLGTSGEQKTAECHDDTPTPALSKPLSDLFSLLSAANSRQAGRTKAGKFSRYPGCYPGPKLH